VFVVETPNQNPKDLEVILLKYSRFFDEIRKRILVTVSIFILGTIFGFIYVEQILKFLINIFSLNGINIVFTSPFQFINLSITSGFTTGIILAFPVIVWQFISFLKPALKRKEYKILVGFLPGSILLFIIGFGFGMLIMKWQVDIFLSQTMSLGIGNMLDISRLLSVSIITSALMGVAFETPILLLVLLKIGIIKHPRLSKARPWVYLGSFIFAILLPPDSILADILLTLPLVLLFEVTLLIDKISTRKKDRTVVAEGV
jgi:sec-independent protein translocase protein TatC